MDGMANTPGTMLPGTIVPIPLELPRFQPIIMRLSTAAADKEGRDVAHNIYRGRMAYVGETPWHGLGREVPRHVTAEDMIKAAGLARRAFDR